MDTFQPVFKPRKYWKYGDCEPGTVLAEGVYKGSREGDFGIQHLVDNGKEEVVLNSAQHLNWLIGRHVKQGDLIRVIYAGNEVLSKGRMKGKKCHQFEVLIANAPEATQEG